jgi:hypothetical protein
VGAAFHKVVLLDTKASALRRFVDRSEGSDDPAHRDAQQLLDRQGCLTELTARYDRLLTVIAARPATKVIRTQEGKVGRAYRELLACLA